MHSLNKLGTRTLRNMKKAALALAVPLFATCAYAQARVQTSTGTVSSAGEAGPQSTVEKRFSAWGLSCAVAQDAIGSSVERCMISQMVATELSRSKVVLGITVDYLDSPDVPTMRFRFSAGAQKDPGIGVKIDDRPEMRLVINNCNEQRCESVGRLSPNVLQLWRSGKQAQLAFIEQGGKQVLLPISLAGFDQALVALKKQPKTIK